ncbi:MAG: hypothetical protein H6719_29870 [Sandaracinaceae bacterium]|nr:hypothetical protein [Sandaracinaceae bacterium]
MIRLPFLSLLLALGCTTPLPIFDDAGRVEIDAGPGDAGFDGGPVDDAGPGDAGFDGGFDAGLDGGFDGGLDAGSDAGVDAGPPPGVLRVTVGSDHTCALLDTGVPYCWGRDDRGQLGDGTASAASRATPEPVIDITNASLLQAGWGATCAVDATDGQAMCWGHNSFARFGTVAGSGTTPTPVPLVFIGASEPILDLQQNASHLCVRTATAVHCSGRNRHGQLGRSGGDSILLSAVEGLPFGRVPRSVAVGYSATSGFTLIALDDGSVWCFGTNDDAECAMVASPEVSVPTAIPGLSRIVQVVAGSDFACALDDAGAVFCWGSNSDGHTGNGTIGGPDVETPTAVAIPAIGRLSAEGGSVIAVTADGHGVYGWGANTSGLLGLGPAMSGAQATPTPILVDAMSTFEAEVGQSHACLLQRRAGMSDTILCAGSNGELELGMSPAPDPTHFNPIVGFP